MILSPLAGGRIPRDGGSAAHTYNTWEYGIPASIAIFALWTVIGEGVRHRRAKKKDSV